MTHPPKSQKDTLVGVAVGALVLFGLYGLYTLFVVSDTAPPIPIPADQEAPSPKALKKEATRPPLPPSGKMSHPPKGASGGAGGGPGGSFQAIGDGNGDGTMPSRSSNPFASGGAGKRVGSGGGSSGGQF